jgi:hypothetical protein
MLPLKGFDNEWEPAIFVTGLNFLLKLLAYTCIVLCFHFSFIVLC